MSLEATTSLVADLEKRHSELESAIADAVRNGKDSIKLRQDLKSAQQKLQAARSDVARLRAAERQTASEHAQKVGDVLAGDAIERITSATAPLAELLAGVSVPVFTDHAAVAGAMQNVAAARQRVNDAEEAHAKASAEVNDLATKGTAKRERHSELVRKRVTGEAGEGGSAELYALGEDMRTLSELHAAAKTSTDALVQPMHDARIALTIAESQATKIEQRLQAEHLAAHAKALDQALIAALRASQAAGAKAGVSLGAMVSPSAELRTWIGSGHVPQSYSHS